MAAHGANLRAPWCNYWNEVGKGCSMVVEVLQFVAVISTAVTLGGGLAHLLELPNKMKLSREEYRTVQQIYRGWALLGIAVVAALLSSAALTFASQDSRSASYGALVATVCIALTFVVFFSVTFPVNRATRNWTELPGE